MSRKILTLSLLVAGLILPVSARSITSISWHTIDGGGGASSSPNAGLQVQGTLGQWDAGTMSSARFELQGGFWAGGDQDRLFRDRFES
jgi:hypothetical protein